ncbi:protein FAM174C [Erpetoichthys calabaricus]|uniref:protein FAM174C n=1 Tax=Erpetoichthys calabaricus TaxID=27687 RepID=UPI00109F9BF4|nr:protein FAM174C [Erpetoichthys calabaricus]
MKISYSLHLSWWLWFVLLVAQNNIPWRTMAESHNNAPVLSTNATTSSHLRNETSGGHSIKGLGIDRSMVNRALYVLIGFSTIGVFYFVIRAVRLNKAPKKKYGLLSSDDNMELAALDSDDDDTVYEAKSLRR